MTTFHKGDIVKVKPDMLNPGETGEELWMVLDANEAGRVFMMLLGDNSPIPPTEGTWAKNLEYQGHIDVDE